MSKVRDFVVEALVFPIRLYQRIHTYFFMGVCRFYPTCS
ncbi:MAG: membrane protein insertion efficiency factor YidD, partial [Fibrobacter sp.]|nr:membrane protein insertion efficiency factor YidD [Fibrobacter sp.]